jgi:hypothetical protein
MGRPLNKRFFNPTPKANVGEAVASYTFTNRGSYTTLPTVTVSVPSLPGGVTATGTLSMRAASATVAAAGADYVPGDVLTVVGGTGTAATFEVATVDAGGEVLTVTLLNAGSYTALATNPVATTTDSVAGAGATLTVTYEVANFTITNPGSGYISAADAALTFAPASTTVAVATLLATLSNVILARAKVVGSNTVLPADISRQVGTQRYVMTTTDGTSRVALTTTDTPAPGGAYVVATDANGSTYWVTKITSRRARLVRRTMSGSYLHETGATAAWSFAAPELLRVQIENI